MLRYAAKPGASLCRSAGKHSIGHGDRSPSTSYHAAAGLSTTFLRNGVAIRDYGTRSNPWSTSSKDKTLQQPMDFSTELIPLGTAFPSSSNNNPLISSKHNPIRILGLRHFSDSSTKKPSSSSSEKQGNETETATPSEHSSPNTLDRAASKTRETGEKAKAAAGRIANSAGASLKRAGMKPSDVISIFAIVSVFAILVTAPTLVRHMRISDNTYEDIDPEDPVQDLAKIVKEEFSEDDDTTEPSRLGGLDTMAADLLNSPRIQNAINNLVAQLLQSPEVKSSAQMLLKELWNDLIADPETLQQIIHLLRHAIQEEQIKDAAIQLVTEVFSDKEVLDELVELVDRLSKEKEVQVATQGLLVESAHNALNDPEILDHSMEFATDVVGDDVVQQTAGEALYNTLSYAVRPTLSIVLSVFGAGLIVVSVAALRNANANSPADGIDEALLKTLGATNLDKVWKILAMPFDLLISAKDAVVWLVTLPFHLVAKSFRGMGRAGNAAATFCGNLFQWLLQLPSQLLHSLKSALGASLLALGTSLTTVSTTITERSHAALSALSNSFIAVFFKNLTEMFTSTMDGTRATVASTRALFGDSTAAVDAYFKMTADIVTQAYARTVAAFVTASGKVSTGASWVQNTSGRAISGVTDGYDYLNKLATALAFYIEDILVLAKKLGDGTTGSRTTTALVADGYDYLNELASALAFYIEDIIALAMGGGGTGSRTSGGRGPKR